MATTGAASIPGNHERREPGRAKRRATTPLVNARIAANASLTQNIGSRTAISRSGRTPSSTAIRIADPSVPQPSPVK